MTEVNVFSRFATPHEGNGWLKLDPQHPATHTLGTDSDGARQILYQLFETREIIASSVFRIEIFKQSPRGLPGKYGACVYTLENGELPFLHLPYARFDGHPHNNRLLRRLLLHCGMSPDATIALEQQFVPVEYAAVITREAEILVGDEKDLHLQFSRDSLYDEWRVLDAPFTR